MPVAPKLDLFSGKYIQPSNLKLRIPQARALAALVPETGDTPNIDWPIITKAQLSVNAGYTAISGTMTRVLNGVRAGSSSGEPHPGLLARGFIEEVVVDVDGVREVNYRATAAGARAYRSHVAQHGSALPGLRDKATCTNDRYRREE